MSEQRMEREMTPQERAAVQYTMNDLFRMAMDGKVNIVEDTFVYASALQQARQAALLEAAEVAEKCKNDSALGRVRDAYSYVEANLRKLAQEG